MKSHLFISVRYFSYSRKVSKTNHYICVVQYSLSKISQIVKGVIHGNGNTIVEDVFIDSRKKTQPIGQLFIAISGKQHDGHNYINGLINNGFKNFIVENFPTAYSPNVNYIVVKNSLKAIQELAAYHRSQFQYPIIGITGSNGKTIVKEWSYQLLQKHYNICRNPRSYNSQVGVPLSVFQLKASNNLGIFEAGISEKNEMSSLTRIINPTIGIFTNIGDAHSAGFSNETEKIYEKLELFKKSKTLIYRREDSLLTDILDRFAGDYNLTAVTWSESNEATVKINRREINGSKTDVRLSVKSKKYQFSIPFNDDASFENAMHAWVLSLHLGVSQNETSKAVESLQPIEMRLNQKAGINQCIIVSDYYNSDLTSIEIALNWLNQRHSQLNKTIVLSDVEQSSISDRDLYTSIHTILQKHNYQRLIAIGPRLKGCDYVFDLPKQVFYETTEDFLREVNSSDFYNEAILLKGGRSFEFEKIEKFLQHQVHNTVLEINLNALQNNLNYFKSQISKETKIMVMVKAFSYGSGGDEIAHFLQYNNIDYLGVAYADEGVALRRKGIHLPIMVMNSDEDSYDVMLENDLEPELYNFRSLHLFAEAVKSKAIHAAKAHIEVNTGMNRLGFDPNELEELVNILTHEKDIKIQSVFSHFANAEDPKMDSFTISQIAELNAFHVGLSSSLGYPVSKHICNSAGTIRFKEAHFDMIRLGVGLYGFHPVEKSGKHIEPVSTLKSFISQIRKVDRDTGIGYGSHDASNNQRTIAVVAIGYADGLSRLLSQGNGFFVINGKEAPIVGNVCMDMTMCDVSGIDCREGDEVIIFGKHPSIVDLAKRTGTIPYEIMTSVSQRVKRIYSEE